KVATCLAYGPTHTGFRSNPVTPLPCDRKQSLMASTTLGVKVDDALRDRLKAAANKLNCTPHWLHKQAILSYLDKIERGHLPAEMSHLGLDASADDESGDAPAAPTPPFYEFGQDVQPQSVLRAAITAAYRRPEPECVPLLLGQARVPNLEKVHAMASD